MKYVLILGGEFPLRERVLAGAIRASGGLPVFTIAKSKATPWLKFFDGVLWADVMSPEDTLRAVREFERSTGQVPAAVIPMNDFVVRTGLEVAEAYHLNYNSAATVDACRDKHLMKMRLKEFGVPVAKFGAFSTFADLAKLAANFTYPLVIKPRELAGSVGVLKVESPDDLRAVFDKSLNDVLALNGAFHTPDDLFQVEEYIPAVSEVSIEVINWRGFREVLGVTEKFLGAEPYFVEVGHSMPSPHSDNSYLREVAVLACAALDIQFGMAHVEARITPTGEVRVIEVGARTGGDAIMDLIERVYGINPYQLYVESLLDKKPSLPSEIHARGVSAVSFLKAKPGKIVRVKSPGEIPSAVVNLQITAKPGDESFPLTSWKAREGSVEMFWPNRQVEGDMLEHLQIANRISEAVFEVGQVK
jgi:hypothetical protein